MGHTLRVVLDTNVLLSPLILDELRRVLPQLANRHGLIPAEMDDLVDVLSIQAEVIEPAAGQEAALRDANDQPVLHTLLAAQAGEGASDLISGDKDLLALADRYPIVTPAEFWVVHGGLVG